MSPCCVDETTSEWWGLVGDAELGLLAVWAGGRLRDQHFGRVFGVKTFVRITDLAVGVMLRQMGVGTFDLNEALAADGLVAASSLVEVRRVG